MGNNCCGFSCPVEATIQLIGGKYKAVILWHLMNKTLRYNEIHKLIPKATDKMLNSFEILKKMDLLTVRFIQLFLQKQSIL